MPERLWQLHVTAISQDEQQLVYLRFAQDKNKLVTEGIEINT
ncbi:MAG: hypothetical protein ABI557_05585 [Aureliella sp.]